MVATTEGLLFGLGAVLLAVVSAAAVALLPFTTDTTEGLRAVAAVVAAPAVRHTMGPLAVRAAEAAVRAMGLLVVAAPVAAVGPLAVVAAPVAAPVAAAVVAVHTMGQPAVAVAPIAAEPTWGAAIVAIGAVGVVPCTEAAAASGEPRNSSQESLVHHSAPG